MRLGLRSRIFNMLIYFIIMILSISCIIPVLYIISVSLTGYEAYYTNGPKLIPQDINLKAYNTLLVDGVKFLRALYNTLILTGTGVSLSIFFTTMTGYAMARKRLPGRTIILRIIYISSFFSGGLIPLYLLLRAIGLLNTYWAIILPGVINIGTCLLVKNYFLTTLPVSLEESARLNGAGEITILIKIVIPISMPIVAVIALFAAVGYWNTYASALFFIRSTKKYPIMVVLYDMIERSGMEAIGPRMQKYTSPSAGIKMAALVISILPIMCLYPFLQRHFAKGVMIGAVKG